MRIRSIWAKDIPPVRVFEVEDLSDVVVLAGANGVGKTRLVEGFIHAFQSPVKNLQVRFVIEATNDHEKSLWGKSVLDTSDPGDAQLLSTLLQRNRKRGQWTSSVIRFESDRTIQNISPYTFQWDVGDPWGEEISWNVAFKPLKTRFQDTQHSILRKVQRHRSQIAQRAERLKKDGHSSMELDFSDPLESFKEAFRQLLGPKELLDADLQGQRFMYSTEGIELPLNALSSGEREVVNIVFDFILRTPSHSVVLFDEPELHLHPELSYKLLQTLQSIGEHNQFFLCTQSPDIITASLNHSVIFLAPPKSDDDNQAVLVREEDETNQALRLLGHSVGIIALGKKLVLIEGTQSSLDKQIYGSILKNRFPDLVLVPSGGKHTITSFESVLSDVIGRSLWGVEFFMLCDRDAYPFAWDSQRQLDPAQSRFQVLKRYHIENYFLDSQILSQVFEDMEAEDSWLRSPELIEDCLNGLAHSLLSYTSALMVSAQLREEAGNVDLMPKKCDGLSEDELTAIFLTKLDGERNRVTEVLDLQKVEQTVRETFSQVKQSIDGSEGEWRKLIPGRSLFNMFSSKAGINAGRLKRLYLSVADGASPSPFAEIISIFERFDALATPERT